MGRQPKSQIEEPEATIAESALDKPLTRAQMIRAGKEQQKKGRLSAVERTEHFRFELWIDEETKKFGKVTNKISIKRDPFVHIEKSLHFVQNLTGGYLLKITHNPKKWLAGEKHIEKYALCEEIEKAVETYNKNIKGV